MEMWWYAKGTERSGPISREQLEQLRSGGTVVDSDRVWSKGMPQWLRVSDVKALAVSPVAPVMTILETPASVTNLPGGNLCPHCRARNPEGVSYCESCGKAMPDPIRVGPRILLDDALPSNSASAKLVGNELKEQTKTAANALLIVAIIQLVVGGIGIMVVMNAASRRSTLTINWPVLIAGTVGVGVGFLALYFWARRSPLPATIVGAVIYGTLVMLNIVAAMRRLQESGGEPGNMGIGGIGIGWLDIVILAILARGISAALKQRKLAAA